MLDTRRIRAITLDLDDTLWPMWPTIQRATQVMCDWLRPHAPKAAVLAGDRQASLQARQTVISQQPRIAHDLGTLRREVLRVLLRQAGEDTALAEPAYELFHRQRQRVTLFDDAVPALEFLAARYPLVALSNGSADIDQVGLRRYFHSAVSAASAGVAKPHTRIFLAGAQAAGVPASDVLHIGDDPVLDALGALDAGLQTIWLNRQGAAWREDRRWSQPTTVRDLTDLPALLAQ